MPKKYEIQKLPYALDALEPVISKEIMDLHYNKHYVAYTTNLNAALEKLEKAQNEGDVSEIVAQQSAIKFNGGGYINHSIFWTNLAPQNAGGGKAPQGPLAEMINNQWGSLDNFIAEFNKRAVAVQGSGWAWLCCNKGKTCLKIITTSNQDPLVIMGLEPLLGIDVWEHAYYLQYKNVRPDYLKAIWSVVNWKNVEERYHEASKA
jgi:Fe-Mn family superoxide dismutase